MITANLDKITKHLRDRDFMSGADRDKARVKATGECFTPTPLVQEMLDQLPADLFTDPSKTFLDNSCGDGQFLSEVLIRKLEGGIDFATALSTIYGVDLMADNVELCRDRLLCGMKDEILPIVVEGCKTYGDMVRKNIVCADALRYHYRFDVIDDPEPYLTDGEKAEREGVYKHQPDRKKKKTRENKVKYSSTLDNLISKE